MENDVLIELSLAVAPRNIQGVARPVRIWLYIGLVMVFFQVVIGGVTRLTDSGLSITEWAVIQGTLPPLNHAEWLDAFEQYKIAAKKQYESLHADMTLSEFKVIYFWEYFHRLWARLMGFVFVFPFLFFLWKKWMPSWLLRRLGVVILLAMVAATAGWVMVKSGLNNDQRTWVSAYKLITHLGIATTLFAYLFWTCLKAGATPRGRDGRHQYLRRFAWGLTVLLVVQILFGGLMAGMRAGLLHPYWPAFVEGERLWYALGQTDQADLAGVVNYERAVFVKAVVQVVHRALAYLLTGLVIWLVVRAKRRDISPLLNRGLNLLIILLVTQFTLGVLTVINSFGSIPVTYGTLHQGVALLLLAALLFVNFQLRPVRN